MISEKASREGIYQGFIKLCELLKPPEELTISEFSERHRYLSGEASEASGKWHNSSAPHLVAVMDALSPCDECDTVVFLSSAQSGKTEAGNNFCLYVMAHDPGPMIVMQPSQRPMAEAWSKDRLAPMIRDCPILADKIDGTKARDNKNTIFHKQFRGGHISIIGSNSPSGLSSRPARYLMADEISQYEETKQGDALGIIEKRTLQFSNKKRFFCSTPTFPKMGIVKELDDCDIIYEWHLPCDVCGAFQYPVYQDLVWPTGKPEEAKYHCRACDHAHDLNDDYRIKKSGTWVVAKDENGNDRDNGRRKRVGFKMNQFGSPLAKWDETIDEVLKAGSDPGRLKQVVNTVFAEPWIEKGETLESDELYNRREIYEAEVPSRVVAITSFTDIQKNRVETSVYGWGAGEECWLIEHNIIHGRTEGSLYSDEDAVWGRLSKQLRKIYKKSNGALIDISLSGIDCGYATDEAITFCKQNGAHRFIATLGRAKRAGQPIADVPNDPDKKHNIYRTIINVDDAKSTMKSRLEMSDIGPGYVHFPLIESLTKSFFKQFEGEELRHKMVKGVKTFYWHTSGRNEAIDCYVGNLAMIRQLQQTRGLVLDQMEMDSRKIEIDKLKEKLRNRNR